MNEIDAWKKRAMSKYTQMLYTGKGFGDMTIINIAERMVGITIDVRPKEQILDDKELVRKTLEKVLTFKRKGTGHISISKVREWYNRL